MVRKLLAGIICLVSFSSAMAQSLIIAEDGESGNTNNWQVFDTSPDGYDMVNRDDGQNRYLAFTSSGRNNGFMLGNTSSAAPGLNLIDVSSASFRIRTTKGFYVQVVVDTDNGRRYLRYTNSSDTVPKGTSSVVTVGLGGQPSYNGYWHTYRRDLQADLEFTQPGNNIIAVQGFQVRGTIDLDDLIFFNDPASNSPPIAAAGTDQQVVIGQTVELNGTQSSDSEGPIAAWRWTDDKNNLLGNSSTLSLPTDSAGLSEITLTVIDESGSSSSDTINLNVLPPEGLSTLVEDAEQANTANWRVWDKTPEGYSVENQEEDGNRFITFDGTDRQNAFIVGNKTSTAAGLGIENQNNASWRMRTDSPFTVYFAMDTTDGFRYVAYNQGSLRQPYANSSGSVVWVRLGSVATDGNWHLFTRNLQADLEYAQPGNTIVTINGVIIRGPMDIDDLFFYGDSDGQPPLPDPPAMPSLLSPADDARLIAGTSSEFSWEADELSTAFQFELALTTTGFEEPLMSVTVPADSCLTITCSLSIELPVAGFEQHSWRVKAIGEGGESAWATSAFELAAPKPAKPINISPEVDDEINEGATVEFVWQYDDAVDIYDFAVFDKTQSKDVGHIYGMLPEDICDAALCRFNTELLLPVANDHAWRIRARNSSGVSDWSRSVFDVIVEVTDPPATPTLEQPLAGVTLEGGTSTSFSWKTSEAAKSYVLQIVSQSSPEESLINALVPVTACSVDACSISIILDLPAANDYLWQVSASNVAGTSSIAERAFSLTGSAIQLPPTPVNVFPAVAADITQDSDVEFVWQRDADAFTYEFHIFDNVAKNTTPYVVDLLANDICAEGLCRLTHPVNQPVSTYHAWRVRGRNAIGPSSWSRSIFTVVESTVDPEPENTPPQAAILFAGFEEDPSGTVPFTITVDPSSSTDDEGIVSYNWTFGDGSAPVETLDSSPIEHTYTEAGNFTVGLEVSDAQGLTATVNRQVVVYAAPDAVTEIEAARLLTQATFGPTRGDIDQVQTIGMENWLEQQFTLSGESQLAYVQQYSNGSGRGPRHEIWWKSAVDGEDQLRQRVAFALSQLFVVSDSGYTLANAQYGITAYYQMLLDNAFSNYRELLEQVTLHPVMGIYLSMLQNGKGDMLASTRPDENYAREVLQLFTIGLHNLNIDGTTDGSPAFTQEQVEAFARVFTGWNYADAGRWDRRLFTNADMINPMEPFEEYHDTSEKVLLSYGSATVNGTLPAGGSARDDMEKALDNIFYHPNVGPFVVQQLIKRLVTSNPSRQYVSDVANVFNNDGTGTRGNMKAVIKALLMHDEARNIPDFAAYGKLREPVLRLSHLWRTFGVLPGSQSSPVRNEYNTVSPQLMDLEVDTGQAPLKSASVFNFFQPSFSPAGPVADQNLQAPEFELFTDSNELATSNRIGRQIQQYSVSSISDDEHPVSFLDFTFEIGLAGDVNELLDHLNVVLLAGNMSDGLRDLLSEHLLALPQTSTVLLARVRDAITLIMASPDYLVQM